MRKKYPSFAELLPQFTLVLVSFVFCVLVSASMNGALNGDAFLHWRLWVQDLGLIVGTAFPLYLVFYGVLGRFEFSPMVIVASTLLAVAYYYWGVPEAITQTYISLYYDDPEPIRYSPIKTTIFVNVFSVLMVYVLVLMFRKASPVRAISIGISMLLLAATFVYHTYGYYYTQHHVFTDRLSSVKMEMETGITRGDYQEWCSEKKVYVCTSWKDGDEFPMGQIKRAVITQHIMMEYIYNGWDNPRMADSSQNSFNSTTSFLEDSTVRPSHWVTYQFYKDRDIGEYRMMGYDHTWALKYFMDALSVIFIAIFLFWWIVGIYLLRAHSYIKPKPEGDVVFKSVGFVVSILAIHVCNRIGEPIFSVTALLVACLIGSALYVKFKRRRNARRSGAKGYLYQLMVVIIPNAIMATLMYLNFDFGVVERPFDSINVATGLIYVVLLGLMARGAYLCKVGRVAIASGVVAYVFYIPILYAMTLFGFQNAYVYSACFVIGSIGVAAPIIMLCVTRDKLSPFDKMVVTSVYLTILGSAFVQSILVANAYEVLERFVAETGEASWYIYSYISNGGMLVSVSLSIVFIAAMVLIFQSAPVAHKYPRREHRTRDLV